MSTTEHLRRMRWRLTLGYAAVMTVALATFAFLVIRSDRQVRTAELEQDLAADAQAGATALFYEDDELVLDRFVEDPDLAGHYPQLWVVVADDDEAAVAVAPRDDAFAGADLDEFARSVLFDGNLDTWDIWTPDPAVDVMARGALVPGPEGEPGDAAVIAVADLGDWMGGHQTLRTQVLAAAAGLVLLSAVAGYWLAGRSIRPAAQSLAQQERLLADAAHELRTPVARILAVAEGGLAADEPPDVALERVAGVAGDAGRLIDDLLSVARMDAGTEEVVTTALRLDLLAEEVAAAYRDVGVEAVETVVTGDPVLLRRAIANLVGNAVEHGRRVDPEAAVTVRVYPHQVVVADRGPGLDPGIAVQVFERFRTGPASSGHGLGLPIADWIARAHGGTVTVENRSGGGAEATLALPGELA